MYVCIYYKEAPSEVWPALDQLKHLPGRQTVTGQGAPERGQWGSALVTCCGGPKDIMYLDSQVAGNNRPPYPRVDHYWFKVAHNDELLAVQVCRYMSIHLHIHISDCFILFLCLYLYMRTISGVYSGPRRPRKPEDPTVWFLRLCGRLAPEFGGPRGWEGAFVRLIAGLMSGSTSMSAALLCREGPSWMETVFT